MSSLRCFVRCRFTELLASRSSRSRVAIRLVPLALLALLTIVASTGIAPAQIAPAQAAREAGLVTPTVDPPTVAEASNYEATSTSDEVAAFLAKLDGRSPRVTFSSIGMTNEERPLLAATFRSGATEANDRIEPLRVLVIANIHSGECDGKEAMLAMIRDLAGDPQHRWNLRPLELVVVPNYNADGNDRRGAEHRPGQIGPDVMGIRENAQQLDLNRDFMKLEAPETRALVAFADSFRPHVFIDCHTTNGSQHGYVLTYDVPHHPASPAAVRGLLRDVILPEVTTDLESRSMRTFYYGNFDRQRTRWTTYGYEPRYSTEYFGQRGVLAILSESYSYATYRDRIDATRAFVESCVDRCLERRDEVIAATATAPVKASESLPLRAEMAKFDEPVTVIGRDDAGADAPVSVEFWGDYTPTESASVPSAYVLPAEASRAAERLHAHGVDVARLPIAVEADATLWTLREMTRDGSFQGHQRNELTVDETVERRTLPAGSFVVRTDQPLGRLAVQLLEPRGADSLFVWNFFDDDLQLDQPLPVVRIAAGSTPFETVALEALDRIEPTELLTLDRVWGPDGRVDYSGAASMNVSWVADRPHEFRRRWNDRPMIVDAATGAMTADAAAPDDLSEVVALLTGWEGLEERDAQRTARGRGVSADGKLRLIVHQDDVAVVDLTRREVRWLTRTPGNEELVELSPDGRNIAYVRDNDLWISDVATGTERAITTDGDETHFFGKLDWVYQEELYGRGNFKGFWWSPSGAHLALLGLDETEVHRFTVTDHIPIRQELEVTSYPKAGDPNPRVSLGIVEVEAGSVAWVDLTGAETPEPLISRVGWQKDRERLLFQIQDREQTFLDLCVVVPGETTPRRWFRETTGAWVESHGEPEWLGDGSFLWQSSRDGTLQLYRYDGEGTLVKQLTHGPGEVRSIVKIDEERDELWVSATFDSRVETHTYRIDLASGARTRVTEAGWNHSTRVSPDGEYLIDFASTAGRPIRVALIDREGKRRQLIDPNLPDRLSSVRIREPESLQVAAPDGHLLDAQIIRPYDFDPNRKYPVLIHVYSGPQAPTVRNSWGGTTYLWHQYLAQQGVIVWMCDNRSATQASAADAWPIHRNLGRNELVDIEAGIDWLVANAQADPDRIGIWGWSYGGYMSAYALTHSTKFRLGIAGAPVTDWRHYDTIYTERYMGLPQTNEQGYRESSVVAAAGNLHGHLLLIHGSMDDNVHLTNTLQLVYELQQAGKSFDLMIYPKSRHGVSDPKLNRHLRGLMTRTILEKL